jgi:hypothetical protein
LIKEEVMLSYVQFSSSIWLQVACSCRWGEIVSELRTSRSLLFIPQVYEYGERGWNDIDRGKTEEF